MHIENRILRSFAITVRLKKKPSPSNFKKHWKTRK